VIQALLLRSNIDKTLKEEAVYAVSEMDSLLNKHRCICLGSECTLKKKTLTTGEKERSRTCNEALATSPSTQAKLSEIISHSSAA